MGCDIHMYVEYTNKKRLAESKLPAVEGKIKVDEYWYTFGGHINPGRNYAMFGMLSQGVRSDFSNGMVPKGLPEVLGFNAHDDAFMYISDTPDEDGNTTTLEKAINWGGKIINDINGKPRWTENPNWHSHSWLTTEEYEKALDNYAALSKDESWGYPLEYRALLAAMKALEHGGETIARVVFWFDS